MNCGYKAVCLMCHVNKLSERGMQGNCHSLERVARQLGRTTGSGAAIHECNIIYLRI